MDKQLFMINMGLIMQEEGWQVMKCRTIKSCLMSQRSSINAIAKACKIDKLSIEKVKSLTNY